MLSCGEAWLPLFFTKKEVLEWVKAGRKTIDVRKGKARRGETAIFQSGPSILKLKIIKKETGKLTEIVREDNYKLVIPSAEVLYDALNYLRGLYGAYSGVFTAYYIGVPEEK